jgi:hypothetical protein
MAKNSHGMHVHVLSVDLVVRGCWDLPARPTVAFNAQPTRLPLSRRVQLGGRFPYPRATGQAHHALAKS